MRRILPLVALVLLGVLTTANSCSHEITVQINSRLTNTDTIDRTIDFEGKTVLSIHNPAGEIVIREGSGSTVEMSATMRADSEQKLAQISVSVQSGPSSLAIETVPQDTSKFSGWAVDYTLTVPAGVELQINEGAGNITVSDHSGKTTVSLGAGDLTIDHPIADTLAISVGVGDISLNGVQANSVSAQIGTGSLKISLYSGASMSVSASTGVGDVSLSGFPGANIVHRKSFVSQELDGTIGEGAGALNLSVGVGNISIRALSGTPPSRVQSPSMQI